MIAHKARASSSLEAIRFRPRHRAAYSSSVRRTDAPSTGRAARGKLRTLLSDVLVLGPITRACVRRLCPATHEGAAFLGAHPLTFVPDDALVRSKHTRDQCRRGVPVIGGDHADDAIVHVAVAATDYVSAVDRA